MNTVINLNHFQTLAEIDTTYPDWRYLGHSGIKWEQAPNGTRVPAPLTGSALASPFKITRDGNRESSIQKYRLWLWKHIREHDEAVISELASIGPDTALACWCAPGLSQTPLLCLTLNGRPGQPAASPASPVRVSAQRRTGRSLEQIDWQGYYRDRAVVPVVIQPLTENQPHIAEMS